MVHVFLLYVFVGIGESKKLVSDNMYFRDLNDCVWYAQKLHKQGELITSYCLPRWVKEDDQYIY